jgi:hypothetical protein
MFHFIVWINDQNSFKTITCQKMQVLVCVCECVSVCVCVWVCGWVHECECMSVWVSVCVCEYVSAWVSVCDCQRVSVRAHMCECVWVCECVSMSAWVWVTDRNFLCISKVKQSYSSPGHALRFPGGWGSQISKQSTYESVKFVSPTQRPP